MRLTLGLFGLLVSLGLITGGLTVWILPPQTQEKTVTQQVTRKLPIFSIPQTPVYPAAGRPVSVRIPALEVSARIESVGKDAQGRMGVPTNVLRAGWYMLGPRPGQLGQAVIDGHVNTPQLSPSIFYNLHKLTAGDSVYIKDENEVEWEFTVDRIEAYDSESFPIESVFGEKNGRYLNLVTCSGWWDRTARDFTQRTVVFAQLSDYTTQQ